MKLSIITINYNNAGGLKKTLDSVASQICTDFEHIIVDGASTDGSVEVIREYENTLASCLSPLASHLTWLSEPDTGIYNAMNKGVRLAKGEYTLMLNSGDYLKDEHVIEKVLPLFDGTDIIQGNRIEEINDVKYRNCGYGKSDIDFFDVMRGFFLHQASFCRRELFDKYGLFDESYKMYGDTKFFMLCLGVKNATFKYLNVDVVNYDMNGISASNTEYWRNIHQVEQQKVYNELFSKRIQHFFWENEKKIKLYDKLHSCKWLWLLTMLFVYMRNWFIKNDFISRREKL